MLHNIISRIKESLVVRTMADREDHIVKVIENMVRLIGYATLKPATLLKSMFRAFLINTLRQTRLKQLRFA